MLKSLESTSQAVLHPRSSPCTHLSAIGSSHCRHPSPRSRATRVGFGQVHFPPSASPTDQAVSLSSFNFSPTHYKSTTQYSSSPSSFFPPYLKTTSHQLLFPLLLFLHFSASGPQPSSRLPTFLFFNISFNSSSLQPFPRFFVSPPTFPQSIPPSPNQSSTSSSCHRSFPQPTPSINTRSRAAANNQSITVKSNGSPRPRHQLGSSQRQPQWPGKSHFWFIPVTQSFFSVTCPDPVSRREFFWPLAFADDIFWANPRGPDPA